MKMLLVTAAKVFPTKHSDSIQLLFLIFARIYAKVTLFLLTIFQIFLSSRTFSKLR